MNRKKCSIPNKKDIKYDKFYTKENIVKKVLKFLNLNSYDFIIEPSAGAGAFSNLLPSYKTISLDIQPEGEGIKKQNFLNYEFNSIYNKILIVGNPPFGKNNVLSKEFLIYSFKQPNVKTVAFILPNIYKKYSRQSIIPSDFKIVKIIDLPINSFTLSNNDHHIPCSFFIFERNSRKRDLRQKIRNETNDFYFVSKTSKYDFFIFGAAPKRIINKAKPNNRGYYIKSKINPNKLRNNFKKINWIGHSSVNGGIYWLTKTDIIENYERDIYGAK